jgi:hypothetical protein
VGMSAFIFHMSSALVAVAVVVGGAGVGVSVRGIVVGVSVGGAVLGISVCGIAVGVSVGGAGVDVVTGTLHPPKINVTNDALIICCNKLRYLIFLSFPKSMSQQPNGMELSCLDMIFESFRSLDAHYACKFSPSLQVSFSEQLAS